MNWLIEKLAGWIFLNPAKFLLFILLVRLSILSLCVWAAMHFILKAW